MDDTMDTRASPNLASDTTTRRTWIRRALALAAATVALLREPELARAQSCSDWFRRGMSGCLCSCRGGSDQACPSGTVSSTRAWYLCCDDPARNRASVVRSIDCCTTGSVPSCPSRCRCTNGGAQPNWCDSGNVVCTRAVLVATC
ncbi:hypothetical protein OO015_13465 [Thermomicrobium sp. 4228-Ro]|uniref:methylamine dehydrogenase light chain n=1 Tax=Thermomicrobium sp. 4228-Ro TaxID=2993937 RepID=UPI002248AD83|nr:methylamine dehydrogenase light chain [Thermomicrobium sp. 4228-Ro]MCX2728493.1 hypothetical protein [Thermomicrobium sp. 4228-Ro]